MQVELEDYSENYESNQDNFEQDGFLPQQNQIVAERQQNNSTEESVTAAFLVSNFVNESDLLSRLNSVVGSSYDADTYGRLDGPPTPKTARSAVDCLNIEVLYKWLSE